MARAVSPEQERFIEVAERTGQMHVRDMQSAEVGANDRIEQKIHLINCIGDLVASRMLDGLYTVGPQGEILDRYGERAQQVVEASGQKALRLKVSAQERFQKAAGLNPLIDSGVVPEWQAKGIVRGLFSDFLKEYYLGQPYEKAKNKRDELEAQICELQQWQTIYNRENKLRPHKPVKKPKNKADKAELEDQLDTGERMWAIEGDIRAGFLPRTNGEKNLVLEYLDYLDNREYPLGVNNRMFEVMAHLQKYRSPEPGKPTPTRYGAKDAVRAVESIVWEIGDYYIDAVSSLRSLEELQDAIQYSSPRAFVHEDVGYEHPALVALIRSMNIATYVRTGKVEGPTKDPLAGTVTRIKPSTDREPGRHKFIYDQYTRPDRAEKTPEFDDYIKIWTENLTIGEARRALKQAIANEAMRSHFHRQRLNEVQQISNSSRMKQVGDAARECLQSVEPVEEAT